MTEKNMQTGMIMTKGERVKIIYNVAPDIYKPFIVSICTLCNTPQRVNYVRKKDKSIIHISECCCSDITIQSIRKNND